VKNSLRIGVLALVLMASNAPAYGSTNTLPTVNAGWLANLNYYRVASGLSPVSENKLLSASVKKHMIYLVQSDPKYFVGVYINPHTENPASPYYTVDGAKSGNELTSNGSGNSAQAIDSWMQAPFHAIGLLRQGLKSVGFDREFNPTTGLYGFGMNIFGNLNLGKTKIILFPGNRSYSRLDSFQGESPDSRQACGSHWKKYMGLPLWVSLLTSPPTHITAKLITPSGKILKSGSDLCIVDERNFFTTDRVDGPAGRAIIKSEHLVLVFPKKSLTPGLQKISLAMTGKSSISWAFTVIGAPPVISWSSTATGIMWKKPTAPLHNPITGFEVIIGDSSMKTRQLFRTTTTSFAMTALNPASYFVCVRAIAKYRSGTCSLFSSYTVPTVP